MNTPSEIAPGSGNVFADLGVSSPEEALAKAALAYRIAAIIADRRLTQAAAAKALGVDQPKVSALLRGKLTGFSTGRLIRFLTTLGSSVEIRVGEPSGTRRPGHLKVASAPHSPRSRRAGGAR